MKIYTKTGDEGKTSLINGTRIEKYHPQIEAYGEIDQLNASLGMLNIHIQNSNFIDDKQSAKILDIQNILFHIGSGLSCSNEDELKKYMKLSEDNIKHLEREIDTMNENLGELKNFILPGGSIAAVQTHIARTQTRKAERKVCQLNRPEYLLIQKYLNRLSDYFFVLGRYFNKLESKKELLWCSK